MTLRLRLLVLVTLGGLVACTEEVVLGQFLERGDGGAVLDAGDDTDGGSTGASGGTGGGTSGGGTSGGGTSGGGTSGGGTSGGGTSAGGTSGGGTSGGSASDGGAGDAGPELSVSLSGPFIVVADAGAQPWQLTVTNSGTIDVTRPAVRLQVRPAANFSGCEDAGIVLFDGGMEVLCRTSDALAGGVGTTSFSLELGTTLRFTDVTADVLPVPGELDPSNNAASQAVGVAQTGLVPVTLFPPEPRLADGFICVGTLITSYAQCVPGSRIAFQFLLRADGGFGDPDGGMQSRWFTANEGRNITFLNRTAPLTTGYLGASVSATCFEGVIQNGAGRPYAGAFRACLQ